MTNPNQPGVPNLAEPAAQQPLSRSDEPSEVAAIRRLTQYLNQPMINRLRRCADHDTGDGSWGEATIYTPEAIQLVALVDAVDALLGSDGADRDARVRAQALRDFAEAMRVLAEDAPADESAKWPWSGYALAAVKAEEHAGKGFPMVQGDPTSTGGTPEHPERFWWHHDDPALTDNTGLVCAPTPGTAGRPRPDRCVGCGCMTTVRWTRGEPITEHPEPQEEQ
jgi:hypothetical protein